MEEDIKFNIEGKLSSFQISQLRRRTLSQIFIFAILFIGLVPSFSYLVFLFSTNTPPEGIFYLLIFQIIFLLFFIFMDLTALFCGYLSFAMFIHFFRIPKIKVSYFEDFPYKKTTALRPPLRTPYGFSVISPVAFTIGAGLLSNGKFYGVYLDLMKKIQDFGLFRFYYIKRPGLPLILTPLEVINFEVIDENAPYPKVEKLLEGVKENSKGKLSSSQIEIHKSETKKSIFNDFLISFIMFVFCFIIIFSLIRNTSSSEIYVIIFLGLFTVFVFLIGLGFFYLAISLIKFYKNLPEISVKNIIDAKWKFTADQETNYIESSDGEFFYIDPLLLFQILSGTKYKFYYFIRPGFPVATGEVKEIISFVEVQ